MLFRASRGQPRERVARTCWIWLAGLLFVAFGCIATGLSFALGAIEAPTGTIASDFGDRLELSALDGSNRRVLVGTPEQTPGDLVWSPNGAAIALVRADARRSVADIYVATVETRTLRRVAHLLGTVGGLHWSPGSDRIAFAWRSPKSCSQRSAVYVADARGKGLRILNGVGRPKRTQVLFFEVLDWHPGGQRILYKAEWWAKECVLRDQEAGSVMHVGIAGGPSTVVRASRDSFGVRGQWSPDGRLIAFTGIGPNGGLRVARPDGQIVRQAQLGVEALVWSAASDEVFTTVGGRVVGVRVDNGRERTVMKFDSATVCEYCDAWVRARSRNGRSLIVSVQDPNYKSRHVVVDVDKGRPYPLPDPRGTLSDDAISVAFFLE